MDHTLTDNNGRKADFRNVIIVMTTNAGAETMNKATIGFTNPRQAGDEMADIKRLFTPVPQSPDATVSFKALDEQIILRVVDKFLHSSGPACREEGRRHLHRCCASTWRRRASIRWGATDAATDSDTIRRALAELPSVACRKVVA
jgi:hypothetical protein